ncbi:extensin-1-like [Spodoptera litura]|uniref:Extensin-1-like n=1 Tax=Spodoptera litura TaxID=69820 RepID=A0A9J7EV47_SPOLT|nr:extensin-1-like [Spodoptera litura]
MFLSKAFVVLLVAFLGPSWFPGDGFVSASPLPQLNPTNSQAPLNTNSVPIPGSHNGYGYNSSSLQYNSPSQQYNPPPQQYNAPPQQYNPPPQHYNPPPQQYNLPPQPYYPQQPQVMYPQQPQVIYVQPQNQGPKKPPLLRTWDGLNDWAQNIAMGALGQNPLKESKN